MTEQDIIRVLREGRIAASEAFRDELLARCLSVLGSDEVPLISISPFKNLSDDELAAIVAAGSSEPQVSPGYVMPSA